jgi:hypothetical protein
MEVWIYLDFISRISMFLLDIQWLKNHVDIVEDFANFLIQVNSSFLNKLLFLVFIQVIKKVPTVVHHCPNEAFVLLFQFGKFDIST